MLLKYSATAVSFCVVLSLLHTDPLLSTATPTAKPPTSEHSQTAGRDNITKEAQPASVFPNNDSFTAPPAPVQNDQSTKNLTDPEEIIDRLDTQNHTLLHHNITTEGPKTTGKLKGVMEAGSATSTKASMLSTSTMSQSPTVYKASAVKTKAAEQSGASHSKSPTAALTISPPLSAVSSSMSSSSQASSTSSSLPTSALSSESSSAATPRKSSTASSAPTTTTTTTAATTTTETTSQASIPPTTPKMVALRAEVSPVTTTVSTPLSSSSMHSLHTDASSTPSLPQASKLAPPAQAASGRKGKELTGAQIVPPDVSKNQDIVVPQPLKVSYDDLKAANNTTKKNADNNKGKNKPPEAPGSQDTAGPPGSKAGDQAASPHNCQSCSRQGEGSAPALRYQAAVSAVLTHHFGPDKDVIVPFDLELVDLADNYDNESGVFFCSIPGTYVISVHLMSHPGSKVNARIFINSRPVAALWADDNKNGGFYPSSSIQTISQLQFGDQVYVMLVDGGYGDSWVHANYNVFTLFLLYEDFMGR